MSWERRREGVCHVLAWLSRRGLEQYEHGNPTRKDPIRDLVEQRHKILGRQEVEALARARVIDFQGGVVLIPPPNDKDAVAILHCHWEQADGHLDCRIYYGLWQNIQTPEVVRTNRHKTIPVFTAYRFEIPEFGNHHNYYHSQYCISLGPLGTKPVPEALPLSVTYPAWPIAAENELQLALSFIVAIYGFKVFDEFENETLQSTRWRTHAELLAACRAMRALQKHRI
jgi:hypothetical protein